MQFGLIYELSTPRPFTRETQKAVYENAIEQVVLAEQLGFSSVWCVEHHFLEEYSHSSCPEMFLTAVARATSKIRVGFGIATCVPTFHHPIRWAEKAAFLDILSGGRVEFGTGRSSTWNELAGFGANIDDTKKTWDEYIRVIPQMWMNERYGYQGQYHTMPERNVLPKPWQQPHPPMWVAVTAPGTELDAADRGMGALILSIADVERNVPRIAAYRDRITRCHPVGAFVNDQIAIANWLSDGRAEFDVGVNHSRDQADQPDDAGDCARQHRFQQQQNHADHQQCDDHFHAGDDRSSPRGRKRNSGKRWERGLRVPRCFRWNRLWPGQ